MINMRYVFIVLFCFATTAFVHAQEQSSLFYFLPKGNYDPNVPTPASFLGFEVGDWHASHDQQLGYMRELARTSKRIQLREYGKTHERRPLICLTITHPDNLKRLDEIKSTREQWINPDIQPSVQVQDLPAVLYMGYSIHGNEASGANAALAVAYWLAAAQGDDVEQLLKNTIILLDPCFNPDGMQRFSSWVNTRRSQSLVPDPTHDEFNETWPSGRTNHYWFDLNRDWLVMQQPESEGRVRILQEWHPNVLTDHHEMGSNSTFFFQPGVPSRVNPVTPARNQQLTADIAQYHARALSEKGIQFYSGENFDDFYYGKGSTYPDANGCIGILFEQGSSRGSAQETNNGLLTFAYSVRNQVITSFSTLNAVRDKRAELNQYLRDFYQSGLDEGKKSPVRGYVLQAKGTDHTALDELTKRLFAIHRIQCFTSDKDIVADSRVFKAGKSVVVPVAQPQYRLIRGIFERFTQFQDSVFYDISAWTLPDAFGLDWAALDAGHAAVFKNLQPLRNTDLGTGAPTAAGADSLAYAFIIPADAPGLLNTLVQLQKAKYRVKIATLPFETEGKTFAPGSLVINNDRQPGMFLGLKKWLDKSSVARHYTITNNGQTTKGPFLGSNNFVNANLPKVVLLTGDGTSPLDAGEIWHYLDTRLGMPPVLLDKARLANANLSKYNVLILPDGRYENMPTEKIKDFATEGGTIIATGAAVKWLKQAGIGNSEWRSLPSVNGGDKKQMPFTGKTDLNAARTMPGAIFTATADASHPLCYGLKDGPMPVFLPEALYLEPTSNAWQNPLLFTQKPLLAGYMHPTQQSLVSQAAAATVQTLGNGRVISFAVNPNFRGFWYGTQRLMGNAVFFNGLMR
jgi:hypothetical protein